MNIIKKTGRYKAFWNCICDCGKEKIVNSSNLTNKINPTKSCGCYCKDILHEQKKYKRY